MRSMAAAAFAMLALATAAACATPNLGDDDLPLANDPQPSRDGKNSGSPSPTPSGSGTATPAPAPSGSGDFDSSVPPGDTTVDAGPQARRWKGSLASTASVSFGGGEHCQYRITLKQVTVDVTAAGNGDIVATTVTALAVEEVLSPSCANTAIPAHTHTYTLVSASQLSSGVRHLELAGPSTNHPAAALVVEGDFRSATPELTLDWHRTDFGPPLDWRVRAKLTATEQ